ncbi:putative amino acid permease [Escherichia coli]|uniref:Putative amino acid permease n=1 Tax=Escherichia coli TaxID=562 RepID=A0A376KZ12_ECOLX|nr:putative amino acid permease [Escherichia coli]
MLMTAALNLGSLASVASATFLICYLAVFVVAIRLRHDIHASLPILIVGTLVMLFGDRWLYLQSVVPG